MDNNRQLAGLSPATIERLEEYYRTHPTRRRLEEVVESGANLRPKREHNEQAQTTHGSINTGHSTA